eukprot:TRINITY_DN11233_c0_g1_i1.p1 TRINITY_DN11233_c0_g1~~TRINITY_DN11233_c0_g1_i1.p1  ORF type:complete len:204 (+),score=50.70 TRINITY_DN11233_c0_g1_i1:77-688(+)
MNSLFGKKKTVDESCKEAKRDINGTTRGLGREVQKLEREEAALLKEIKKAAGKGDEGTARVLSKQLITLRQQRDRLVGSKAQMGSLATKTTAMSAQHKQMEAMGKTAAIMGKVNAQMKPEQMQQIMQEFTMQNQKMDMAGSLMDDAIDGLDDEDLDDETQNFMNQVIDEVCSDIRSGVQVTGSSLPARSTAASVSSPATLRAT